MIKVAVAGAAGRMGQRLLDCLGADQGTLTVSAFERSGSPMVGTPAAFAEGVLIGDDPALAMAEADVLVDFTAPEASLANLAACAEKGKAAVVGTTGWEPEQVAKVKELAQKVPLVFASNMSVGMNLMFKLVKEMAEVLGHDYALELLEAHHDQKKDAPSGTAVTLLDQLRSARGWHEKEVLSHGRKGMVGARPKEEIGVSVIRGGDIVGDHTVYFIGQGERLELTHRAHNRDTFAKGAVRAAVWVADKKPGLYSMRDVLGL